MLYTCKLSLTTFLCLILSNSNLKFLRTALISYSILQVYFHSYIVVFSFLIHCARHSNPKHCWSHSTVIAWPYRCPIESPNFKNIENQYLEGDLRFWKLAISSALGTCCCPIKSANFKNSRIDIDRWFVISKLAMSSILVPQNPIRYLQWYLNTLVFPLQFQGYSAIT